MDKPPTAKQVLDAIETSDVDDEIERVLAMTPEERRKELVDSGYVAEELDAKADALFAQMKRAPVEQGAKRLVEEARKQSRRPPARSRPALWLLAAAVVVGGAGVIYAATRSPAPPNPSPLPPPPPSVAPSDAPSAVPTPPEDQLVAAATLRRQARQACDDLRWDACRDALERARSLDPAGERTPGVAALRAKIANAVGDKK